jgi:hypothetical protein
MGLQGVVAFRDESATYCRDSVNANDGPGLSFGRLPAVTVYR